MKIIVAGGRDFADYLLMSERLDFYFSNLKDIVIVCGEAKGADSLGRRYAEEHNITVLSFPADWNKYGKSAGFRRNEQMAEVADGLVAFWDGKSKGTEHMISLMRNRKKQMKIVKY